MKHTFSEGRKFSTGVMSSILRYFIAMARLSRYILPGVEAGASASLSSQPNFTEAGAEAEAS